MSNNDDADLLNVDRNRPRARRNTIEPASGFYTNPIIQSNPVISNNPQTVYNDRNSMTQSYQTFPTPRPETPAYSQYNRNQSEAKILSQLSLIETIYIHLNQKKICKLGISPELEGKVDNLLRKLGNYPHYVELLTKLKLKFKCEICLRNPPQLSFKCGHNICGTCFCNRLGPNVIPPAFGDPQIRCFICMTELDHSDYSYFFLDWEDRMKAYDKDMRKRSREGIKCKGCKRVLAFTCFTGCKCFCYECQLNKKSLGYCECGDGFNYIISCDYCRKQITTPYMHPFIILCSGHICCEICMPQLFEEFICKICKKHLTDTDVRKLAKFCIKQCNYCAKQYSSNYFLTGNCCQAPVCILCQYSYHKTCCVSCRRRFEFSVDEYMESFKLFR